MRYASILLAGFMMGFAPAPFPKPEKDRPEAKWTVLMLVRLQATVAAPDCQRILGWRGEVVVDVTSNTLFLRGKKCDIDRTIKAIEKRDREEYLRPR